MTEIPIGDFDVDFDARTVLHRPSGMRFKFYEYTSEADWQASDSVTFSENPAWLGDRLELAAAAKRAALDAGMTARRPHHLVVNG